MSSATHETVVGSGEFRYTAMDGKPHLIEVTAVPIIAQGNRHLGALVFFNEVSR